jgi:broad specificity phosphatase PhoE
VRELALSWTAAPSSTIGQPTRIVASDLRRASESARIFAARWDLEVEHDPRLRELHFGEWDGREWGAIEAEDGARLRAWTDHWADTAPPGGETVADVAARAASFLADELAARRSGTAVVVSHAGWIRAAVGHLLGRPVAELFDHPADHARATIVRLGAEGPALVAANIADLSSL